MGINKMRKVCLDLHDFSVVNNRLDILLELKEYFTNFKVSLFTVPVDKIEDWGPSTIRKDSLEEIKKHLDWIQIIPHGYNHESHEFYKCSYELFKDFFIPHITSIFNNSGLPFENGFCAPHWRWNNNVIDAMDDCGWWGAIDRDKKMPCPSTFYKYNFLLNEPFWKEEGDLKLHGHIYGTKNDVGKCLENILKLPKDTEWCYVTDFLEEKK